MRRYILHPLPSVAMLLLLTLPVVVQAQFTYTTNNGGITITGYSGPGGNVIIPSVTNGYPVTRIGTNAFYQHSNLYGITIPNSVTSIGDEAFCRCNLSSVLIMGTNLTSIGESAFSDCWFLTNITIPNSVTNIGAQAFYECIRLADVTIGTNVTSIGEGAFWQCGKLANITIPNGVRSIGDRAFSDCLKLTSITIPSSVISIGDYAFSDCRALSAIMVDTLNSFYVSLNGVLFDSSQTTLLQYPAGKGGTSYTIPDSVTTIGGGAFYWCQSFTSITIPDSVTNIGVVAFFGCTNLAGVYFSGNAPSPGTNSSVFSGDNNAIVYYLPGTTGWSSTFDGRPTALWFLPNPQILNNDHSLGVQSNGFGFIISWATNIPVVVEASTNLANPLWFAVATNTLTNGLIYFRDPQWANYPGRYYRLRSP